MATISIPTDSSRIHTAGFTIQIGDQRIAGDFQVISTFIPKESKEDPGKFIMTGQNIWHNMEWGIMYKSGSYWLTRIKMNKMEACKTMWLLNNPRLCMDCFERLVIKYNLNIQRHEKNIPEQDRMYFL